MSLMSNFSFQEVWKDYKRLHSTWKSHVWTFDVCWKNIFIMLQGDLACWTMMKWSSIICTDRCSMGRRTRDRPKRCLLPILFEGTNWLLLHLSIYKQTRTSIRTRWFNYCRSWTEKPAFCYEYTFILNTNVECLCIVCFKIVERANCLNRLMITL